MREPGFGDLLASNEKQTLEFFIVRLVDICEADVDRLQLAYNASILAHYASVSTTATSDLPTPATLSDVFDNYVFNRTLSEDGEMMETAGAQCLLLSGFFASQMSRRYPIKWYSELGSGFFHRASRTQRSAAKAALLRTLSDQFEPWRLRHAQLGRYLQDQPYLLKPPTIKPS